LVLAGTEADGLLRSTDGGATWHRPSGLDEGGVAALAFDSARRTVAAATEAGIVVSLDGGTSWQIRPIESPQPALSMVFSGQALLVGLHRDGVTRSDDLGASWHTANDGLGARLDTELVFSPEFARDRTLFVTSLEDGLHVSTDGGVTWDDNAGVLADLSVHGLAVSDAYGTDRTIYLATSAGIRVSRDGGRSWDRTTGPSGSARAVASGPGVVVAAVDGGRLVESVDGGNTWHTLAAPLDDAETITLGVSPTYARDRTMFAATIGSSETVVWRTTDGGQRWHRWLVDAASGVARVTLAVAPTYTVEGAIFVGLGRRVFRPVRHAQEVRSGERRPMWQSTELGPEVVGVTALAVSPAYATDRTVFAATNAGMFVSRNGGERFEPWNERLAPARMVSVALSPAYPQDRLVYGLGLGGAVWRRVDASR
jgi:photosystem II stability/assembly factor-like uncharacterized protein